MYRKKLLFTLLFLGLVIVAKAQTTRIQFLHNSSDQSVQGLDIYVNGNLLYDNLFFHTGTPFLDVPAGANINIGIATDVSNTVADTFYNLTINLSPSNRYVGVISGIESTTGYSPAIPFDIKVTSLARESALLPTDLDILFMNGSTDASITDLRTGLDILADDINYGDFATNYTSLTNPSYTLRLTNTIGNKITHNYLLDIQSLSLQGVSGIVLTSGFLNTSNNSNGEPFGLWLAKAQGGPFDQLPTTNAEALARLQLINNCADSLADTVDVYINGSKEYDDFAFRTATAFEDVYANLTYQVDIAKSNSTSVNDAFYSQSITIDSGKSYVIVANGIESDTNYKPLPPYILNTYNAALEEAGNANNTDVLFMHGSTDAPNIDIKNGTTTYASNFSYGSFSSGYTSIPTTDFVLEVDEAGSNPIELYSAMFATMSLQGLPIVLLSSGFIEPDSNSNGPSFGMWYALPTGGQLIPLPVFNNIKDINNNPLSSIKIWPNPATETLNIDYNGMKVSEVYIYDATGKAVTIVNDANQVNIQHLNSGLYFAVFMDGQHKIAKQFIKQ